MSTYLGDFRLGDTFDLKFTTVAAATGLPTTLAGTPVVSAYPANSATELTAGITLSVDFDSRTGMHNVRVVATSGNGYATATNYALVITTGTVGGTSVVGYVVGHFSIENRSAVMPTVATRTLDVTATGEAGLDWANVGAPSTTVALSGTTVKTATDVEAKLPAALVGGKIDASVVGATLAATYDFAKGTVAMAESYAADGAAPTPAQALFQILGREYEFAIAGDTLTVKKLDGSTTAMTFTLAPPGGPYTSITRTT